MFPGPAFSTLSASLARTSSNLRLWSHVESYDLSGRGLEDPRWVLYAVKGKLGKGEALVPGTMLDLKSMQDAVEEICNIPVQARK